MSEVKEVLWRPHPERPEYLISDEGDVWSQPRTRRCGWGRTRSVRGRFLRRVKNKGKLTVTLSPGGPQNIGRVVLRAFVGPAPAGMECCHNNGDHTDNRVANLRWGTKSDNSQDRLKHGYKPDMAPALAGRWSDPGSRALHSAAVSGDKNASRRHPERLKRGTDHPGAKLTDDDVREIRRRVSHETHTAVAADFGVARTLIGRIVRGEIWRHVA